MKPHPKPRHRFAVDPLTSIPPKPSSAVPAADGKTRPQPDRSFSTRDPTASVVPFIEPVPNRRLPLPGGPVAWEQVYPFTTEVVLHLAGGMDEIGSGLLAVKGWRRAIRLNRRQFLVMLVLVCHSLALAQRSAPIPVNVTPFLSAKGILEILENFLRRFHPRPAVFLNPTAQDIVRVVAELRAKLVQRGVPRTLIDNELTGRGYRLNTSPAHVSLSYIEPEQGRIRDC